MSSPGVTRSKSGGQVVPLMAGIIVLVAFAALGAAALGKRVVDRARAQNAADAAALGAAVQPDPSAAQRVAATIAQRNHAELVELHRVGVVAVVHVRLGDHDAAAAARPVTAPTAAGP